MLTCIAVIFFCALLILFLPALAIAFAACILGVVFKLACGALGLGLRITFGSIFLCAAAIALLILIL